jgi:3-hydroxyisobutyrate dehydrogenase-like beta-hydroxyacid dehydrogenase
MKVGIAGVGEMGAAMAGHLLAKGHEVTAFDVDAAKLSAAAERGIATVSSLEALAKTSEIFLAVVSTDEQSASVTDVLSRHAATGRAHRRLCHQQPEHHERACATCASRGKSFIDAPVVYGASGAREGTLLSLCGGSEEDVERARPGIDGLQPQRAARGSLSAPANWQRPATTCCTGCIASRITRLCSWPSASESTPRRCAKFCSNAPLSI